MITVLVGAILFGADPLDSVLRDTGMRPPRNGGVYVVAHRGAHEAIPENTLAAYRAAIELGCDFVEVDVRHSKEGRLVSIHDARVDAYTEGAEGAVREFTLAELKGLDIGSRISPEWAPERIPTIEEVFELCSGAIGIYLDVKEPEAIPHLLELVRKYGMERDVLWYTEMPQQAQVQANCAECLLMPDPGPEHNLAGIFDRLSPPPRVIASVARYCSDSFVNTSHVQRAIVIVDEGTREDWPAMLAWGVDGIQTDHPGDLIEYLRKRR